MLLITTLLIAGVACTARRAWRGSTAVGGPLAATPCIGLNGALVEAASYLHN